jgi:hypothetical protein
LIEQSHSAAKAAARLRAGAASARPALLLLIAVGLAGCHHKSKPLVLPQAATAPVELEIPPAPANPMMIQPVPEITVVIPPPPPPRQPPRRKPAPAKEAQPPAQVASAAEPAALAIGALSNGGESTPQSQQQTRDLIAAIRKRLAALPARTAGQQKNEVSQVNRFLKQAQQALDSGDAEGANNLAVKAKLLMDDVEKK